MAKPLARFAPARQRRRRRIPFWMVNVVRGPAQPWLRAASAIRSSRGQTPSAFAQASADILLSLSRAKDGAPGGVEPTHLAVPIRVRRVYQFHHRGNEHTLA